MRFIFLLTLFFFPVTSQAINPAEVDMHKIVAEMSKRADEALKDYTPDKAIQTGQVSHVCTLMCLKVVGWSLHSVFMKIVRC